ncbi:hypothetical protein EV356DRAFT_342578 [Viridothelium virens]|uniref:Uncharacterized protein n=1 Tax=Viridothelium virens TaxID=1048519 RepID=A0A6A6GXY7_VIRVR|nr:hypothetical protein EV356DRAFT_342578 [Viridothelium virens]
MSTHTHTHTFANLSPGQHSLVVAHISHGNVDPIWGSFLPFFNTDLLGRQLWTLTKKMLEVVFSNLGWCVMGQCRERPGAGKKTWKMGGMDIMLLALQEFGTSFRSYLPLLDGFHRSPFLSCGLEGYKLPLAGFSFRPRVYLFLLPLLSYGSAVFPQQRRQAHVREISASNLFECKNGGGSVCVSL